MSCRYSFSVFCMRNSRLYQTDCSAGFHPASRPSRRNQEIDLLEHLNGFIGQIEQTVRLSLGQLLPALSPDLVLESVQLVFGGLGVSAFQRAHARVQRGG